MTPNKHYAGYIVILAAVSFVSCQQATQTAQGPGASPSAAPDAGARNAETEVPASTVLWVQLQKDLDSSKLKSGDHFSGQIIEDVILNGKPVIPKGTPVKGRVTNSSTAEGKGSAGLLSLVLDGLTLRGTHYDLNTNPLTLQAAPLEQDLLADKANKAVTDAKNAFVPKNGILQFYLANAVRVKS